MILATCDDNSGFDLETLALHIELGSSDCGAVGDRHLEATLENFQFYSCGTIAVTIICPRVADSTGRETA